MSECGQALASLDRLLLRLNQFATAPSKQLTATELTCSVRSTLKSVYYDNQFLLLHSRALQKGVRANGYVQ